MRPTKTSICEESARRTNVSCCNEEAIRAATPKQIGTAARPGIGEVASRSVKLNATTTSPEYPAISANIGGHTRAGTVYNNPSKQPNSSSQAREGSMKKAHSGSAPVLLTAIVSDTARIPVTIASTDLCNRRGMISINMTGHVM